MERTDASAVETLIVAVPETAGSALYGMIDVLAVTSGSSLLASSLDDA